MRTTAHQHTPILDSRDVALSGCVHNPGGFLIGLTTTLVFNACAEDSKSSPVLRVYEPQGSI
jgi:hypothetical protein